MFPIVCEECLSFFRRYFTWFWVYLNVLIGPWWVNCFFLWNLELVSLVFLFLFLILFLCLLEHIIIESKLSHVLLFFNQLIQTLQSLVEFAFSPWSEMEIKPEHRLSLNLVPYHIHVLQPVLIGWLSQETISIDGK